MRYFSAVAQSRITEAWADRREPRNRGFVKQDAKLASFHEAFFTVERSAPRRLKPARFPFG